MTRLQLTLLFALANLGAGCSTMSMQADKMSAAKSTAIVGFRGTNSMKRDEGKLAVLDTVNNLKQTDSFVSGDLEKRKKDQGQALYTTIAERIQKELNWQVAPPTQVAENGTYKEMHAKFMNEPGVELQKKWMIDAEGVVWDDFALRWSAEERKKLMDALNVDTLTMVGVELETGDTGGVSIGGIGKRSFHPRAIVRLQTFARDSATPIWETQYTRGEATEKGLEQVMGVDQYEQETELFAEATKSALDELFKKYREQK